MIFLSVILPIRNEENFIARTMEMLVCQDYPAERFEVIVVDGMSMDRARTNVESFIQSHPGFNIHLLENPGHLSSRARNIGIRAAQGQMIAVIDGHVHIPNKRLFSSIEELREKKQALCLSRPAPLDVPEIGTGAAYWIAMARKNCWGIVEIPTYTATMRDSSIR